MAMCFSLAALGGVTVRINDPGCVAKTFPGVFRRAGSIIAGHDARAPVIAIDGPSASGKGTVAQLVAQGLGFHYLDSGALYRLVALAALRAGVPLDDEARLASIAASLDARFEAGEVWLAGEPVTDDDPGRGMLRRRFPGGGLCRRCGGAARAPAGLPPGPGSGRRRPRHGIGRFPGCRPQGVPHRERPKPAPSGDINS